MPALTVGGADEGKGGAVLVDKAVDDVDLLQGETDSVLLVGVTWHVGCPELKGNGIII